MQHFWIVASVVGALVGVSSSAALAAQAETAPKPNQSGSVLRLDVKAGRVTLTAKQVPLTQVIEAIARQANVSVIAAPDAVYPDVSVSFQDVTVEQALRDLLKGYDTFFFYRGGDPDKPSIPIKTVWVYRQGEGELLQPLPPEEWASTADLERGLADSDPRVRAKAIEALVDRSPEAPGTIAAVQQALNDDDDNVRATALSAAVNGQMELSPDQLAALAASDRSPDVRLQALTALSLEPDVLTSVAETVAASDADPRVRTVAKQMLEQLKASAPPPGQTRTP